MISFNGYEEVIKKVYDHNQEHVFEHWDELKSDERKVLLDDISTINFELLEKFYSGTDSKNEMDFSPAPYIPIPETDYDKKKYREARDIGIEHIREGKVAAFVVAGGQGSRLGFDGPKGKYPVGAVSGKTLFQIHVEKILKYSKKYNTSIPLLVMTSKANYDETFAYFEENAFFGNNRDDTMIFSQNIIPSIDSSGKIILRTRISIFKNPDGHGGSLTALYTSKSLEEMKRRGIETISYFQVDNPLVNIIDPVFIGFHVKDNADISSKALKKSYPEEKVGVFVEFSNNRIGVVEYSDLPEDKAFLKDKNGELEFSSGSIAIHLFKRKFIERITSGTERSLPYHTAKKKIRAFKKGTEEEIDGYKFEKFVFDALLLTDRNIIFETKREDEFAPVKNATGVDSVESAQKLMTVLYRGWLKNKGIKISDITRIIEISPLLAVEADDLENGLYLPDDEMVYLE